MEFKGSLALECIIARPDPLLFFRGAFLGHGIDLCLEAPQVTEKLV